MRRFFLSASVSALFAFNATLSAADGEAQWYKGNTHAHSLWSDGNDFPEMIVDYYKEKGYDFMALSDHNILAVGEKWMSLEAVARRQRAAGKSALDKYLERFGEDWVEIRGEGDAREVRLKTLEEYRPKFEEPGEFLVIQAEEVSASYSPENGRRKPIHLNAINLGEVIPSIHEGNSVQDVMRRNLRAVAEQEKELGRPIMTHLNHPNFGWAVTAEDLAHVVEEKFFEVYNGHPGINHLGSDTVPGDEQIWDIANAIRLGQLNAKPLLGVATDDSHTYHGGNVSPGRGWVVVKAKELTPEALITAMRAGDFYASSGIELERVEYDAESRKLTISIKPDGASKFSSQLIGTRKAEGENVASKVGEVFATQEGSEVEFTVPKDALYARVTITSSKDHPNPSFGGQKEQAWTQPVGWELQE